MSYISEKEFLKQDKEWQNQLEQIEKHVRSICGDFIGKRNNKENGENFKDTLNDYMEKLLGNNLVTFEVEIEEAKIKLIPCYKGEKIKFYKEFYKEVDLETAIKECIERDSNVILYDNVETLERILIDKYNNDIGIQQRFDESDEEFRNRIKKVK
ncbi:TPA: hypothetical protein ACXDAY_003475 [Clostridium botulinum]|uniref:hypothetical protein n=1 Tax=Clostridium botulinum TaxID=1491 RepID=UPI00035BB1E6|nr:hypothetical protein [Clostridium botulinum]EPS56761.1 hypothetical protein CLQ_01731 [Clostridium botulinum Af84]MBN3360187.1 hypothetical protein [Clostridium botulinum]NFM82665.1 hypothetical protein [Clostridium botulinum]NFP12291.1 hypothetical protein [Clostridium botulinum]NFR29751.1 hypothetical protein [Clostridium botulinum]